ncbi:ABC transporter ATP-binding protein [Spiribacter halobius]|uniref:ABC transporter ATP-binding protein n=1 Tax=Sediminicurvatus halobius TaxID=2182432 RepID=A0A2U2N0N5_9GAMM|nr:sn-glycerol-3-phosphate ABC transporter ATP-binding protein UgpC [Spiribacter halobius]PWG62795.1 ABC transporter ATP-binding protein [Spiribacter halobius]UEX77058.1 sn-glycerol-3-phosphate ABC transporter ATP-binding protein UgpC [Spiribacter halobius]
MTAVTLSRIDKHYGDVHVLRDISIDVEEREFMVFVGPSGCGKSTLLRSIAGLEPVQSGRIVIGGEDVTDVDPAERGVAMVFQSYALFPHMTVFENIAFGLRMARRPEEEIRRRVQEAAAILQIEPLLERKPRALSGGQRQRVAVGRAIVRDPKVFLFDEPLSNLDAALRVQMRLEIIRLHQRLHATMIYVTHDQTEAMTMADRIVVLRDGRVEQIGSPLALYREPANRFVAGFIGSPRMNFLDVALDGLDGDGRPQVRLPGGERLALAVDGGALDGERLVLGVRPEHLVEPGAEAPSDLRLRGEAVVVEHLGGETLLHVRLAGEAMLEVKASGDTPVRPGDQVEVGVPAHRCHLFRGDEQACPRLDAAA